MLGWWAMACMGLGLTLDGTGINGDNELELE